MLLLETRVCDGNIELADEDQLIERVYPDGCNHSSGSGQRKHNTTQRRCKAVCGASHKQIARDLIPTLIGFSH